MHKTLALLLTAAVATYAIHAYAQVRDARTVVTPIGSSSSNGNSFAWFYDSSERAVYVCRVGQNDAVECKSKVTLP
jgi:hypothetical protein